jgi:hypothetical protein
MSWALIFRIVVVIGLSAHVAWSYAIARTIDASFGARSAIVVLGAIFALFMLVPMVWAITLPDWPEIWTQQVRGRRRWNRGQCPSCGYPRAADPGVCSECGAPLVEPRGYRISGRTVRRYAVVNLVAWVLGCGLTEAWLSADEAAFRVEVEQRISDGRMPTGSGGFYGRKARFPRGQVFIWDPEKGFSAGPDLN